MKTEKEIRRALREWIMRKNGKIHKEELDDQTQIMEEGIIRSVQLMDLVLFLEYLTEREIDVTQLKKGVFRNIDSIYRNFFVEQDP